MKLMLEISNLIYIKFDTYIKNKIHQRYLVHFYVEITSMKEYALELTLLKSIHCIMSKLFA